MTGEQATDRRVLAIGGADCEKFLQGLITNDVGKLESGLVYAAILTPQGKYLADFFLRRRGDTILLDAKDSIAAGLAQRLNMYKLRADVQITETDLKVSRGIGDPPAGAMDDPRHSDLGWRAYGQETSGHEQIDWDALRVAHCIPETSVELQPNETFILEAGLADINGVDFKKGCYVGQEVTARMRHKTDLRKGLVTVDIDGSAPIGSEITADGKSVGTLFTQSGGKAIAYLRFDRATGEMQAGDAQIIWKKVG